MATKKRSSKLSKRKPRGFKKFIEKVAKDIENTPSKDLKVTFTDQVPEEKRHTIISLPVPCPHHPMGHHHLFFTAADARSLATVLRESADDADKRDGVELPMAKVLKLVKG